jgi:hypothetical protein
VQMIAVESRLMEVATSSMSSGAAQDEEHN